MKDSGVQWLGEIPSHWDVKRFKFLATVRNGQIDPTLDEFLQCTLVAPNHIESGTGSLLEASSAEDQGAQSGKVPFKAGDVLYSKIRPNLHKVCLAPFGGICSSDIYPIVPNTRTEACYLLYTMLSTGFRQLTVLDVMGATIPRIDHESLMQITLPLPPLHEQRAIASYLDRETARIDRLIDKTEALNALLSEKRVALISRAVTKGLEAGAEMKESGVQWLGEIPAHWDIRNFKYIARLEYGDSLKAEDRVNDEVPVFGSNGVVGSHNLSNTLAPAIIVGRKGSFGKVNYSNVPVFAIDTTYFVDERTTSENLRWVYYFLQILELDKTSKDSAVPGLGREEVYSLRSAVPPLHEQRAIAEYLDRETARIDALIKKNDELIALLREKRTALISAAVTGKIEVDLTPAPAPPGG